jgi:hypothetical protein
LADGCAHIEDVIVAGPEEEVVNVNGANVGAVEEVLECGIALKSTVSNRRGGVVLLGRLTISKVTIERLGMVVRPLKLLPFSSGESEMLALETVVPANNCRPGSVTVLVKVTGAALAMPLMFTFVSPVTVTRKLSLTSKNLLKLVKASMLRMGVNWVRLTIWSASAVVSGNATVAKGT